MDKLKSGIVTEYSNLKKNIIQVLNNYPPEKKIIVLFNNIPFLTKTLRKIIIHKSKLKNIYTRKRSDKD